MRSVKGNYYPVPFIRCAEVVEEGYRGKWQFGEGFLACLIQYALFTNRNVEKPLKQACLHAVATGLLIG